MAKARVKSSDSPTNADPMVNEGRALFNEWCDAWSDNREKYLEDTRFVWVRGAQWPDAIANKRRQSKRPCLEINQLPAYVRQVTNDQRQNRPSIRLRPVSDATAEDAERVADIVRGIEYQSKAAAAYDTAFETTVVGGYGACRIVTEYEGENSFDQVIRIKRIANPLTVVPDPYFNEADASDMSGCFVYEEVPRKAFDDRWPDADPLDFTEEDKSGAFKHWANGDSVIVADWYKVEVTKRTMILVDQASGQSIFEDELKTFEMLDPQGVPMDEAAMRAHLKGAKRRPVESKRIVCRKMTGNQILETWTVPGELVPVALCFGDEVNIEGERVLQGMCRRATDPQQMYNFWVTSATERAALMPKAPYIGYRGQFKDPKWASANDNNYPFLETDVVMANGQPAPLPQRQTVDVETQGVMAMAAAARSDLQMCLGMWDQTLGKQVQQESGIALRTRDKMSDTGTFHYIDNLSRMICYIGRVIVGMVPEIYDRDGREVPTVKEDRTEETVVVNQKTADPTKYVNDVRKGKYDVIVEVGPSYATKRQEAVDSMTKFMEVYPQAAQIIGDLYAMEMDWPGAKKVAERLKLMLPPAILATESEKDPKVALAAIQSQMQGIQQQLTQAQQEVQRLGTENYQLALGSKAKIEAATIDANVKREVAQFDASVKSKVLETDRDAAIGKAQIDAQTKLETELLKIAGDLFTSQIKLSPEVVGLDAIKSGVRDTAERLAAGEVVDGMMPPEGAEIEEPGEMEEPQPKLSDLMRGLQDAAAQLAMVLAAPRRVEIRDADGNVISGVSAPTVQ